MVFWGLETPPGFLKTPEVSQELVFLFMFINLNLGLLEENFQDTVLVYDHNKNFPFYFFDDFAPVTLSVFARVQIHAI